MIASVGLWVIDTTLHVNRLPDPGESVAASAIGTSEGGKAANQVVAAARLGAETALLGAVGEQPGWPDPLSTLRQEGVDIRHLRLVKDVPNGRSVILLTDDGDQVIVTYPGPGEAIDVQSTIGTLAELDADILLLQGETEAEATIALGQAFAGRVIFDPSPVGRFVGRDLSFADILTPNWSEAQRLTSLANPTAHDVRRATGSACVIVTHGAEGVDVAHDTGSFTVPTQHVVAVDPTGAGDAFNGALAAALDRGEPLREAVLFGTRAAAWSVQRPYCIPSYPVLGDLLEATPTAQAITTIPSVKENHD